MAGATERAYARPEASSGRAGPVLRCGHWAIRRDSIPGFVDSEMELTALDPRDPEIERGLAEFAGEPGSGMIITASSSANTRRQQLLSLALRYRLPTVCPLRFYLVDGGLAAYGPNVVAIYSRAADYVDRILKGARPADLPVQAPTRYELVINSKAAKALALSVPASLLARADEVIE